MKNNKIEIYINGNKKIVNKNLNLKKILKEFLIKNQLFAVELNNEVIPKSQYKNKRVMQNDKIEILELIGGG